ncbi:sugar phosphate nucleotidyltransferase [Streptomyces sedi]|uniref:Glucose-1-phosphate thymidylyltransferase n=1 Tax=Streptomyces sedi TaxID=555059 RepID=A0A5C4VEP1_9ACTN|nr:sugar phosphate nucleotidyltransferase [Streptomyces sedi]TNM34291.1 sugar nucleotidyltransferase [Streptomyces sedi]
MGELNPVSERVAGIVLVGGTGSRLFPTTRAVNKHLLPVYDKPAVAFSMEVMAECGVDTLVLVCNAEDEPTYRSIPSWLGYAESEIRTVVQREANGIAGAISCAREHLEPEGYERVVVALGDTLYVHDSAWAGGILGAFETTGCGAAVAVIEHPDPRDFGIVESDENGTVVRVREKADVRYGGQVCTGLYSFDGSLWKRLESVVPSARGELEITSLLESYIDDGGLATVTVPEEAGWFDVGTPDRLVDAAVARRRLLA